MTRYLDFGKQYWNSITTRMLIILSFAFLLMAITVGWIIQTQVKPKVLTMTSQTVEETGNEAINSIMSNIAQVDGLAKATSSISAGLPKDDAIYQAAIGNLMTHTDPKIVGGGVWFDPNMYDTDTENKAFVWTRDTTGEMQPTYRISESENPYYRDWWYTPALYARHNHCVWSRAYVDAKSNLPMMTCAKALYSSSKQAFEGVVSFDLLLDDLGATMQSWQNKVGGYVFLTDLDNRFLTFPDSAQALQKTDLNPQGKMMNAQDFAGLYPDFKPIADSLERANSMLISQAVAADEARYNLAAGSILSGTNLNRIGQQESNLLSALLLLNDDRLALDNRNLTDSHLVETVTLKNDPILNQPATAFVFTMPMTHWKMVVVKPQSALMAVANKLSKQLVGFMLLGFVPILLLTALAFRHYFTRPLHQMARTVAELGVLIQQKKYLQLLDHKLPKTHVSEIDIISQQTNNLVERVVENEGALADINVHLEKRVAQRTEDLQQAMTELKASQVQLVRSEKMASLGQMVAGVAHEVNTPLGYVRSNLELVGDSLSRFDEVIEQTESLLDYLQDPNASEQDINEAIAQTLEVCQEIKDDEVSDDLAEIVKDGLFGVDQISELVLSLRDFSRIDESKVKDVNINDCVHSSLVMAKNNLKTLTVIEDLGDLPTIQCNPSQINQVLLNLFNNAAQAIPDGVKGELKVRTTYQDSDGQVAIVVEDNGAGMSEAVLSQIFEPFYTTKKAGEGTGLGLAISNEIIEQHHGIIVATSEVGIGTRFEIHLPLTQPKSTGKHIPEEQDDELLFSA